LCCCNSHSRQRALRVAVPLTLSGQSYFLDRAIVRARSNQSNRLFRVPFYGVEQERPTTMERSESDERSKAEEAAAAKIRKHSTASDASSDS